jgi:hypothetical protein
VKTFCGLLLAIAVFTRAGSCAESAHQGKPELIREKVQISDNISKQWTNPTAVPSNAGNSLEPTAILNAGNNASTNMLLLLTPSVISVTNSN